MSEVFILGAGFSKAISDQMPLTVELSKEVLDRYRHKDAITRDVRVMIGEDFEKALTFLVQDKPWLRESENLRHKALYLDLTHCIRGILHDKSRHPEVWGTNRPPPWLEALVTYWHKNRSAVITLNYDTLIERVASSTYWKHRPTRIPTGQLYPIPLTPAAQRSEQAATELPEQKGTIETFRLLKLHGSTNWFYSGRSQFSGEDLYYVPCKHGIDGAFDAYEGHDPEKHHWTSVRDKTMLIIPPVLDKSAFFQHESLRSLWLQAAQAIKNASRVVCMGYSLPSSDLTMAQFLKSSAPTNRIPFEIVDAKPKQDDHFAEVIGKDVYDFKQGEADKDCVPTFVVENFVENCIPDPTDRARVRFEMFSRKQPTSHVPDQIQTAGEAAP